MTGVGWNHLAERVAELWCEERCDWTTNYQAAYYSNPSYWTVSLEWTSERSNPHHADYATYTWQFYADDLAEALSFAVKWLEDLAAFTEDQAA